MALQFDPEYAAAVKPLLPLLSSRNKLSLSEIPTARKAREAGIAAFFQKLEDCPDVKQQVHHVKASDGYIMSVLAFYKKDAPSSPGPAVLHLHGGGMILGSAELHAKPLAHLVSKTSVPIFSVNYRLAPEHKDTVPVEDAYTALLWLTQQDSVDSSRIAVYGESAGGALAAGVVLMARDLGLQPPLAKQILIYPMLDDQNQVANDKMEPFAFWKTEDNVTAWTALLGDKAGDPDASVSPYSAPARATSLVGLPSTYLDVGGLDIFRDETVSYAARLMAEDIQTELHVYPGVPHAFEMVAPHIKVTKRALNNRESAILEL
ncbi:unnamed protein product [Clonostachys byssicola]|uniref:Alpha/beta hydrolase fold-3 domain-containing protein n=1 Tax=Clonostachys byssicola TaxID=160290 RepID=A0A9N9UMC3_9HYPO|nr:unnamed protein product [Clonostachys byssicola]